MRSKRRRRGRVDRGEGCLVFRASLSGVPDRALAQVVELSELVALKHEPGASDPVLVARVKGLEAEVDRQGAGHPCSCCFAR